MSQLRDLTVALAFVAGGYAIWAYHDLRPIGGIVFGLIILAIGLAYRMGHLRDRMDRVRHWDYPLLRNGPFACVPGGIFFVATGLGGFALDHQPEAWAIVILVLTTPTVVASFFVSLWWIYSPPDIAKPAWLRAEEAERGGPVDPNPSLRKFERFWIISIFAIPVILAILAYVGVRLGLL